MAGIATKIGLSVVTGLVGEKVKDEYKEHQAKKEGTDIDG